MSQFTEVIADCQQAASEMPNTFVFAIIDYVAKTNKHLSPFAVMKVTEEFLEGVLKEHAVAKLRLMRYARQVEQEAAAEAAKEE